MKRLSIKFFIAAVSCAAIFASCEKRLDVEPRQSISFESALTSSPNIEAAIYSVYAGLRQQTLYGRDLLAVSDALADIATATGKSGRLQPENNNTQGSHFAFWATAYGLINEVNLILEAIPEITDATAATKDRWEGELKFLRALLHHNLAKAYGYDTTATVAGQVRGTAVLALVAFRDGPTAQQYFPRRASIKEMYDAIFADLTVAATKLGNNPRSASGGAQTYFANKAAAHALTARAALHYGDWDKVIAEATTALANAGAAGGTLSTAANYVAGWRAMKHPESIFEIRFNIQNENLGVNVSLQTSYTTLAALGNTTTTGGFGDLVPNAGLRTQLGIASTGFPDLTRGADVRAQLFEWGTAGRGTRFIETTKFFGKSGFPNLDNVPVIRVAELYLMRAEAHYRDGNETDALADLNTIITNRGLTAVALTGTALLDEIFRQRMLEFAFEGHRWFDLKRTGADVVKSTTIPFTDIRILANIPQREIDGNPNMVQNAGY